MCITRATACYVFNISHEIFYRWYGAIVSLVVAALFSLLGLYAISSDHSVLETNKSLFRSFF